jgi:hypothetical protein
MERGPKEPDNTLPVIKIEYLTEDSGKSPSSS